MKIIKWLWALVIGMFAVICFAFLSSVFVRIDEFYIGLNKPPFIPDATIMALLWGLVYLFIAYTIAALFVGRAKGKDYFYIFLFEFFNIAFTVVFFFFHNLPLAFGLSLVQFGLTVCFEMRLLKTNRRAGGSFFFVLVWIAFLTVNTYILIMMN